jgi:hypothetical protein
LMQIVYTHRHKEEIDKLEEK